MSLKEISFDAIEKHFEGYIPNLSSEDKEKYSDEKACFVVITKSGKLRGEFGNLGKSNPLWKQVQLNSVKAGFDNKKFPSLKREELSAIKIEIFVVNDLVELEFDDEKELLEKLEAGKGIVLKKGAFESVALPYVWENIQSKRGFLDELCLKAGLQEEDWRKQGVRIWIFDVESEL